MAILQKHLEEALLNAEQRSIIRAIAHAAVIEETQEIIQKLMRINYNDVQDPKGQSPTILKLNAIEQYLTLQQSKLLMQIKIPGTKPAPKKANTTVASKTTVTIDSPPMGIRDPNNPYGFSTKP
jgi:hypothetical protein